MSRRTVQAMIASVQRALSANNVPLGDIHKAINTAYKDTSSAWDWPWLYAEWNVLIPPPYTTGTISIANGTASVVGVATVWDPTWVGRRIRFGGNNVDYIILNIINPTMLTLAQPVNLGANLVGSAYRMWQQEYLMPLDFDPGNDIFLGQPTLRYRIKHIPRYSFEQQGIVLKQLFTSIQMFYTDSGCDEATGAYKIQFMPPVSQVGEYRLVYRKRPDDLSIPTQVTAIPEGYDEVLELIAESRLRIEYNLPAPEGPMMRAQAKLKMLRRMISAAMIDNQPLVHGAMSDSSISQWGLMIGPWQGP